MRLLHQINDFFEMTTIHGFAYMRLNETRCTRFIWTVLVMAAAASAVYFQWQSISQSRVNHTSTKIVTKSIQEFPFPAVTFYPGDYSNEKSFMRSFLNQFEFTRYDERHPLRDNDSFLKLYKWLVSPMHTELFERIEDFLINEKDFLLSKGRIFKDEVCGLVALMKKKISLKRAIRTEFFLNMYKSKSFVDSMNITKHIASPLIEGELSKQNFNKSEINFACSDQKNKEMKTKMEALLLSYLFFCINSLDDVGAGDLASGPFETGLNRGGDKEYPPYYLSTHTLLTNMYNDMANASLPVSVLEFPAFFVSNENFFFYFGWKSEIYVGYIYKNLEMINITEESMRNYHFLWYSYMNAKNFTLFCHNHGKFKCLENPLKFSLAKSSAHYDQINRIRKQPSYGEFLKGEAFDPPCTNHELIKRFKIESVCNFIASISKNQNAFLILMKYTKQSPVYLDEDNVNFSPVSTAAKFGFSAKTKQV